MADLQELPTGLDVARFLGRGDDPRLVSMAGDAVRVVTAMAFAYCNGHGFTDDMEEVSPLIAAYIVTAAARLCTNPAQVGRESVDGYETAGAFVGWSLAELGVLHRFRRRTA